MKYIKLSTIEEYNALNDAISLSRGYPDGRTNTGRYAPDNPELIVTDTEQFYPMELTEDIYAIVELLTGKKIEEGIPQSVEPTPDDSWLKADIQEWLTAHSIQWTTSMTKAELLSLV